MFENAFDRRLIEIVNTVSYPLLKRYRVLPPVSYIDNQRPFIIYTGFGVNDLTDLYINGKLFMQNVGAVAVSENGHKVAYWSSEKNVLYVNDTPIRIPFEIQGGIAFVPKSSELIYVGKKKEDGKQYVIRNEKVLSDGFAVPIWGLKCSSNGTRVAYRVGDNSLYINNKQVIIPGLGLWGGGMVVFSADEKHFAFMCTDENGHFVVVDGRGLSERHMYLNDLMFTPVSHKMCYVSGDQPDRSIYPDFGLVIDGTRVSSLYRGNGINNTIFSEDESMVAYISGTISQGITLYINHEKVSDPFREFKGYRFTSERLLTVTAFDQTKNAIEIAQIRFKGNRPTKNQGMQNDGDHGVTSKSWKLLSSFLRKQ